MRTAWAAAWTFSEFDVDAAEVFMNDAAQKADRTVDEIASQLSGFAS